MDTQTKIKAMLTQIGTWLSEGKSINEIPKLTFEARERGEDMLYFGWGTKCKKLADAYLEPRPTSKQKEYKDFFAIPAEGKKSLPKYSLWIYGDGRIEFYEKKIASTLEKVSLI